jgi:hypothetical protein
MTTTAQQTISSKAEAIPDSDSIEGVVVNKAE